MAMDSFQANSIMERLMSKATINNATNIFDTFKLLRCSRISNDLFEKEFTDKQLDSTTKYKTGSEVDFYGFLTTINSNMVSRIASNGLKTYFCPYNYLGYHIAGVHVCRYMDVALMEASEKANYDDEVHLIVFKCFSGRRRQVAICDKNRLLAPTPGYDSHIADVSVDLKENYAVQYVQSLEYLYEFVNYNYDPVVRPRHCSPFVALTFAKIWPKIGRQEKLMKPLPVNYYEERKENERSNKYVSHDQEYMGRWLTEVQTGNQQMGSDSDNYNYSANTNNNMRNMTRNVSSPMARNSYNGPEDRPANNASYWNVSYGYEFNENLRGQRERSPITSRLGYQTRTPPRADRTLSCSNNIRTVGPLSSNVSYNGTPTHMEATRYVSRRRPQWYD